MSDVKPGGRRSAPTRARIVAAAHGLFVAKGYAGTTFQEVADDAAVSVQTVYFHYGTKSGLLKHVVDVASVGDDDPVPVLDRPWFAELRAATDPAAVVRGWTHQSGIILGRVAPVLAAVRDAAATDADMAVQWETNRAQRRTAHGTFIGIVAKLDALRPGLTRARATDIAVALLSPELFLVVTRESGWTVAAWETWTAAHLTHDLVR